MRHGFSLDFDFVHDAHAQSFLKSKDSCDNFALLLSHIIYRRMFIKLCQLQFLFAVLISALSFLHLQLTTQIGNVMRAKAKVRAQKKI